MMNKHLIRSMQELFSPKILLLVVGFISVPADAFSSSSFLIHHPAYRAAAVLPANKQRHSFSTSTTTTTLHLAKNNPNHRLSSSDKDRLLMGEIGLTAFIVAEMRHFVNETVVEFDQGLRFGTKWSMSLEDKVQLGLATKNNVDNADKSSNANLFVEDDTGIQEVEFELDPDYVNFSANMTSTEAVDFICNVTQTAFSEGFRQSGLLSALGSAILYFRGYYQTPKGIAACERIGLSDYAIAHHITDMYHHRTFRGTYTKTLPASGKGEIAAALAVGLVPEIEKEAAADKDSSDTDNDDECLLWSPTTPGLCLHWKSDDEKWRKTRFERIQMEGTKDPRRGGSGTTR